MSFKRSLLALGVAAALGAPSVASAQYMEDFTGGLPGSWSGYQYCCGYWGVAGGPGMMGGSNAAYTSGSASLTSPVFTAAGTSSFSFVWYFDGGDYMPFNDYGYVNLYSFNTSTWTNLVFRNISMVGNFGDDQGVYSTTLAGGNYQLEFGTRNQGDESVYSNMWLDNVSVRSTTPEPASLVLLGTGVAGVFARRRRNKA